MHYFCTRIKELIPLNVEPLLLASMNTTIIATTNALTALHINAISAITGSALTGASKAIQIEDAKKRMREGVCHFIYQKKDGSYREAFGTLNRTLIAKNIVGTGITPESWGCSCYWDCVKGGFRSFRWQNIIAVLS